MMMTLCLATAELLLLSLLLHIYNSSSSSLRWCYGVVMVYVYFRNIFTYNVYRILWYLNMNISTYTQTHKLFMHVSFCKCMLMFLNMYYISHLSYMHIQHVIVICWRWRCMYKRALMNTHKKCFNDNMTHTHKKDNNCIMTWSRNSFLYVNILKYHRLYLWQFFFRT